MRQLLITVTTLAGVTFASVAQAASDRYIVYWPVRAINSYIRQAKVVREYAFDGGQKVMQAQADCRERLLRVGTANGRNWSTWDYMPDGSSGAGVITQLCGPAPQPSAAPFPPKGFVLEPEPLP